MPCRSFVVVYMIWMLERICGTISAAIRPCSRRAPISISVEPARPESAEATVKPATPIRNIFL